MRISHRHRFIFYANPKTGSESVRKVLDPHADVRGVPWRRLSDSNPFYTHMPPSEARELFRARDWPFEEYRGFVFVRNPWQRLVSLFRMILRYDTLPGADDRDRFLRWLATIQPGGPGGGGRPFQKWRRFGTYSLANFAGDGSGNLLVDRVIRLEDIEDELRPYLASLGLPAGAGDDLPHINRSDSRTPLSAYYTPEAVAHVRSLYAEDIERFGYRFDG